MAAALVGRYEREVPLGSGAVGAAGPDPLLAALTAVADVNGDGTALMLAGTRAAVERGGRPAWPCAGMTFGILLAVTQETSHCPLPNDPYAPVAATARPAAEPGARNPGFRPSGSAPAVPEPAVPVPSTTAPPDAMICRECGSVSRLHLRVGLVGGQVEPGARVGVGRRTVQFLPYSASPSARPLTE